MSKELNISRSHFTPELLMPLEKESAQYMVIGCKGEKSNYLQTVLSLAGYSTDGTMPIFHPSLIFPRLTRFYSCFMFDLVPEIP